MQLTSARITNFRSVEDSESFTLDQVTSLVGKNEAGKSALLQALGALNPHSSTPLILDALRDYPRRYWNRYKEKHPDGEAVVVTTDWKLDDKEFAEFEDSFGKGTLRANKITVLRRYGATEPEWLFEVDATAAIAWAIVQCTPVERDALKDAADLPDLVAKVSALAARSPAAEQLLARFNGTEPLNAQIKHRLAKLLPRFLYVSSYDVMAGDVQVEELTQLSANKQQLDLDQNRGKKLFYEFFEFAHVPLAEIVKETRYEAFDAKLEAASNAITDQMLEYWTQNQDLEVRVRIEQAKPGDPAPLNTGSIARARIYNTLHRATTPFNDRSAGFIWFFSFLVKFDQVKRTKERVVILLDEPGLTLHGKAQAQLLKYFEEKLAPDHQVVYSTHSPFMVAPDKLHATRIVEDKVVMRGSRREPLGTKVSSDVLHLDKDSIFPLQGALGYEVSQSLFVGKHTLLVEGPSDILYLQALSNELHRRKRTGLDERWTICPSGGIDKIAAFVSLFGGNGIHVAVLTDLAQGDKTKLEKLRKSDILKAGHLYSATDFTGKTESDVEDFLDPALYCAILNAALEVPAGRAVTPALLASATPATPRIMKQAETVFRTIGDFSHYTPAYWLITHPALIEADSPEVTATLGVVEKVFKTFNALLPGS